MALSNIPYKTKIWLILGAFCAWCVVCSVLILSPADRNLHAAKLRISSQQVELMDLQSRRTELEQSSPRVHLGQPDGERILSSQELPGFLKDLGKFSSLTQTTLETVEMSTELEKPGSAMVSSSKPSQEPAIREVPFRICIQGGFPQVYQMIRRLESYNRLISIRDIQVRPTQEGYPNLEVTLPIVVYVADFKDKASGHLGDLPH